MFVRDMFIALLLIALGPWVVALFVKYLVAVSNIVFGAG